MTNPTPHGQVPEALRLADYLDDLFDADGEPKQAAAELRRLHAYCQELESQVILDCMTHVQKPAEIEHVADDVSKNGAELNMSTQQPAPAAQQAGEMPESIEQLAVARYKVAPAHESMFHRWAVVAGDGEQQLYLGREVECENMARKFAGAFLDGAFVFHSMLAAAPTHPAAPADSVLEDAIKVLRADLKTSAKEIADEYAEDAARLDWLLLHISGAEFRRIGVHYSGNASRADVDAARKQGANHD